MMKEEREDNQKEEAENQDKEGWDDARDTAEIENDTKVKRLKLDGEIIAKGSMEEAEKRTGDDQIAAITEKKKSVQMSIWVWEEVLKFITRMEMAERVSFVCHCIKKLCWPRLHGDKVIPHMVEELSFGFGEDDEGRPRAHLVIWKPTNGWYGSRRGECIPIATVAAPPDYIQGFSQIVITFLDSEVLQFVRNIHPLLANLHLDVGCTLRELRAFHDALNGCPPIASVDITSPFSASKLRQHLPGFLEKVPVIFLSKGCIGLGKLILTKLESGKSFVLIVRDLEKGRFIAIGQIQKAFQSAVQPHQCCMMISLLFVRGSTLQPFRMENQKTGEVLALEQKGTICKSGTGYELYRCPAGEVQQWRERAKKLLEKENKTAIMIGGTRLF